MDIQSMIASSQALRPTGIRIIIKKKPFLNSL